LNIGLVINEGKTIGPAKHSGEKKPYNGRQTDEVAKKDDNDRKSKDNNNVVQQRDFHGRPAL
jgi:hypothetical protein